ncbi:MAG: hypothetical protein DI498_11275 [Paracoccus denitrificans]|nr:MAG: hypothetical protein DI498_11275 [Paracoccus denitrificans]PZO83568.1 MAG: hypothetical protein DI633_11275 [Paracoccus denitrificans]
MTAPDSHDNTFSLRILATTDLHLRLLPFDGAVNRPAPATGLLSLAGMVDEQRADGVTTLLVDNGDLLHGSPLVWPVEKTHPVIQTMNLLGYDAATFGNHDFDGGADMAAAAASAADFPYVMTNVKATGPLARIAQLSVILSRRVSAASGIQADIRIGILGFLPPETVDWNASLRPLLTVSPILETARQAAARIREAGADIVVALCHAGVDRAEPGAASDAAGLLDVDQIDAVVAGHTHQVFPAEATLVEGTPIVLAGSMGSHLGVIDLSLKRCADGWRVARSTTRCLRAQDVLPHPQTPLAAPALAAQDATIRGFGVPIARTLRPITSYFALLGVDPGMRLQGAAMRHFARRRLSGTRNHPPILATVTPFRTGGRGGPENFIDIPTGGFTRRDVWSLYPFPNTFVAVEVNGYTLTRIIERSIRIYDETDSGVLIDPAMPGYNFDMVDGLDVTLDLTAGSARVKQLTYRGQVVEGDDPFLLATNSYRVHGCQTFSPLLQDCPVAVQTPHGVQDILSRYARIQRRISPDLRPFFDTTGTRDATFATAPAALDDLSPIAHLHPEPLGIDADGFARIRVRV